MTIQWPLGLSNLSSPAEKTKPEQPNNTIQCKNSDCKRWIDSIVIKDRVTNLFKIFEVDDDTGELKLTWEEAVDGGTLGTFCPKCNHPLELRDYHIQFMEKF